MIKDKWQWLTIILYCILMGMYFSDKISNDGFGVISMVYFSMWCLLDKKHD